MYKDYSHLGFIPKFNPSFLTVELPEQSVEDTERLSLLNMIYTTDPESGLPVGDIGQFMNKNLAPEVVQWVKDNLMQDTSSFVPLGMPEGIDDELALDLARSDGESRSSYITRVRQFMDEQKELIRVNSKALEERAKVDENVENKSD